MPTQIVYFSVSLLAIINNSDMRPGFEFDCFEVLLVRGARPLIDFQSSCIKR